MIQLWNEIRMATWSWSVLQQNYGQLPVLILAFDGGQRWGEGDK